jgi:hypothetical protein
VLTIFSSTDYCGSGNVGVVARFGENLVLEKEQFAVLNEENLRMRRVFFPVWLLDDNSMVVPIEELESDLDSQPEDGFDQEFGIMLTI